MSKQDDGIHKIIKRMTIKSGKFSSETSRFLYAAERRLTDTGSCRDRHWTLSGQTPVSVAMNTGVCRDKGQYLSAAGKSTL